MRRSKFRSMKIHENLRWWENSQWIFGHFRLLNLNRNGKGTRKSSSSKNENNFYSLSLSQVRWGGACRSANVSHLILRPGLHFRRMHVSSRSECEFTTFILWPIWSAEHLTTSSFSLRCIKLQLSQNFWMETRVRGTCAAADTSDNTRYIVVWVRRCCLASHLLMVGLAFRKHSLRPPEYFTAK